MRRQAWRVARVCLALVGLGLALALALGLAPAPAHAGVPVTLYRSFAGNLDYTGTAGSLRSGACGVLASGAGTLSSIPAGATIEAAYLYWAGSGATVDSTITLDTPAASGVPISADRTFTESYVSGGSNYDFYSGFADVTSLVAAGGNGAYSVSNLSFDTAPPYSSVSVCLGGWSLVVIYEAAGEPLRVVNLFDGFQQFRGSAITLTADNFVIPSSSVDGKLGHVTWEGDLGNSASLGGFSEQLIFEGTTLSDADNPANNQFNSVSNATSPTSTPEGVDFDVYVLDALLSPGQTSGVSVYSSGGDRVLLSAEIFSVTNTPVSNLSLTKAATADFRAGEIGTWQLDVTNTGPSDDPGPITITDTLPAGVSFDAAGGTGWSCSESGGVVDCSFAGGVLAGASLPPLAIDVLVDVSAAPSVSNTASVTGSLFDNDLSNNTGSTTTNVLLPDLGASTKSVLDPNGGEADPGDVLRYTITLVESVGSESPGVRVTDDLPANVTAFSVVSIPAGASDLSTGAGTGAQGTGFLDVQGVTVPAGGSVDVVLEVTIAAGTAPGTVLSNTATITPTLGTGASPVAPDVLVSPSQNSAAGSKRLYLGDPNASSGSTRALSRMPPNGLPPTSTLGNVRILRTATESWTLAEALAAPLSLSGDPFPVTLWLRKGGTSASLVSRAVRVDVATSSHGVIASTTRTISLGGTPQAVTFTMDASAFLPDTLPAGDVVTLSVSNVTPTTTNSPLRVFPAVGSQGSSFVELDALTVIEIDAADAYDAAWPGGAVPARFQPGDTLHARALVSDPFGAFDIASATLEIRDPFGATIFGPAALGEIAAAETAASKTFETGFVLPAAASTGTWSLHVVATEGLEGTIRDYGFVPFEVGGSPDLIVFKIVTVLSDPVNGTTNPKAIPGAEVLYTIGISNQGAGSADAESLVVEDVLPSDLELHVGDYVTPGPVHFVDGSPTSGVDVLFTSLADDLDDLEFDDGTGTWVYDPVADVDGFDPSVTAIRVRPTGALQGSNGTPPSFELRFRARVR